MNNMLFVACMTAIMLLIIFWLTSGPNRRAYYCGKCGFKTYSEFEAQAHEKRENTHKVVRE
jgi:hypothetical protein